MNKGDTKVGNNNLPVEKKNNIFSKIASFIRNIFARKEDINGIHEEQPKAENLVTDENIRNNFTKNIKISTIDETVKLQQDYKSGVIKEEDLTEEQYNSLMKLYDKQIDEYKTNISMKKEMLKGYKHRITEMRKKLA